MCFSSSRAVALLLSLAWMLPGGLQATAEAGVGTADRELGESAVTSDVLELARGLESPDPMLRLGAVKALATARRTGGWQVARGLLEVSRLDPDWRVAEQARRALGQSDLEVDSGAHHRTGESREVADYGRLLRAAEPSTRLGAVKALAARVARSTAPDEVIELLEGALRDPDPGVAAQAARALERRRRAPHGLPQ